MAEDSIDRIAETWAANYKQSRRFLGTTAMLCEDLLGLYRRIGESAGAADSRTTEQQAAFTVLLMACQRHLSAACITVMQGRITDGYVLTRSAVEACATARLCFSDATLAQAWLETPIEDSRTRRAMFSTG